MTTASAASVAVRSSVPRSLAAAAWAAGPGGLRTLVRCGTAEVAAFIASDEADYMSGTAVILDGAYLAIG